MCLIWATLENFYDDRKMMLYTLKISGNIWTIVHVCMHTHPKLRTSESTSNTSTSKRNALGNQLELIYYTPRLWFLFLYSEHTFYTILKASIVNRRRRVCSIRFSGCITQFNSILSPNKLSQNCINNVISTLIFSVYTSNL